MKKKVLLLICTGLGSGYSPVLSGTAGSLAYVVIWYFVLSSNIILETLFLFLVIGLGLLATRALLPLLDQGKHKKAHDPGLIVIDEWAGMGIALLPAHPNDVVSVIAAFILFRIFDIAKPGPIRRVEKLPNEWGIMADDLIAGLCAAVLVGIMTIVL